MGQLKHSLSAADKCSKFGNDWSGYEMAMTMAPLEHLSLSVTPIIWIIQLPFIESPPMFLLWSGQLPVGGKTFETASIVQ